MGQKLVKILAKNQSKVEWIGTRATCKDVVADSQHNKSKKLKKPTINWKKRNTLASVRLRSFFLDGSKIS